MAVSENEHTVPLVCATTNVASTSVLHWTRSKVESRLKWSHLSQGGICESWLSGGEKHRFNGMLAVQATRVYTQRPSLESIGQSLAPFFS